MDPSPSPIETRQAMDAVDFFSVYDQPKATNGRLCGFPQGVNLDEYIVQEKFDGHHMVHCGATTYSKMGARFSNIPSYFRLLAPPPLPIAGELYMGPGNRHVIQGITSSKKINAYSTQPAWRFAKFVVYDIPGLERTLHKAMGNPSGLRAPLERRHPTWPDAGRTVGHPVVVASTVRDVLPGEGLARGF